MSTRTHSKKLLKKSGNEREGQKLNGEGTKLQYCPSVETPQIMIQTS